MDEKKVARPTGLFKRGGVYWLRIKVPADLRPHYPREDAYRASLRTSDYDVAKTRAYALWAQFQANFQQKRRELNPEPLPAITDELRRTLAGAVYAAELEADQRLRRDKPGTLRLLSNFGQDALMLPLPEDFDADNPEASLAAAAIPSFLEAVRDRPPPADFAPGASPLAGLTSQQRERRNWLNEQRAERVAQAVADLDLEAILPIADRQARRLGLGVNWHSDDGRAALEACLEAYARARQDVLRRDQGAIVATPPAPTAPASMDATATATEGSRGLTLGDVLPKWQAWRKPGEEEVAKTEGTLKLAKAAGVPTEVAAITRQHGREFQEWLARGGSGRRLRGKTIQNHIDRISRLLAVAETEMEAIPRNPWKGLDVPKDDSEDRTPWSPAQLQALLALPLFRSYQLPDQPRAGGPAAYWLPLLALYSGGRVSELANLDCSDVFEHGGSHWLRIEDQGDGKATKTAAGKRDVPVHSELVRLGFLEYTEHVRASGHRELFPQIPQSASRSRGKNFSFWFNETLRRQAGIVGANPSFHSFRHNARTSMENNGVAPRTADAVTGHAPKGSTGSQVYARIVPEDLRVQAVEAIQYAEITGQLPKVYRKS